MQPPELCSGGFFMEKVPENGTIVRIKHWVNRQTFTSFKRLVQ